MVVCVVRLFIVHCYVIGMYYINVCSCISRSVCKVCKSVCRTYIESISASHELDSKYCYSRHVYSLLHLTCSLPNSFP